MPDQPDITTRDEFLEKIRVLLSDNEFINQCENPTTERFLEALRAWLLDAHRVGFGDSSALNTQTPSWDLFAKAIEAALIYE